MVRLSGIWGMTCLQAVSTCDGFVNRASPILPVQESQSLEHLAMPGWASWRKEFARQRRWKSAKRAFRKRSCCCPVSEPIRSACDGWLESWKKLATSRKNGGLATISVRPKHAFARSKTAWSTYTGARRSLWCLSVGAWAA